MWRAFTAYKEKVEKRKLLAGEYEVICASSGEVVILIGGCTLHTSFRIGGAMNPP